MFLASLLAGSVAMALTEGPVEGHTVWTTISTTRTIRAFDVAVLVEGFVGSPNVLWFNDAYKTFYGTYRRPCGGFVMMTTAAGDNANVDPALFGAFRYRESYRVTDPNGHMWETHLYSFSGGGASGNVHVSSLFNAYLPDDGESECPPVQDLAPHDDPGSNGERYYDNGDGGPVRLYNADLYGRCGCGGTSKGHGEGGAHNSDGTGCEVDTEWECSGSDAAGDPDGREGNSHPYNPLEPDAGKKHSHTTGKYDVHYVSDFTAAQYAAFATPAGGGGFPPANPTWWIDDTEQVESEVYPCLIQAGGYHEDC